MGEPTPLTASPGSGEFDELFAREHQPMVRLATLLVGSSHLAEEAVQDAFASVDARWDEIDRPGAYLRTVVVNGSRAVLGAASSSNAPMSCTWRSRTITSRHGCWSSATPWTSCPRGSGP